MGACLAVDEAAARSRDIDRQNWRDFASDRRVAKLLLLGTGRLAGTEDRGVTRHIEGAAGSRP